MLCIFRSVLKVNYLFILVSFPRKQIFLELEHLTNFNLYLRLKFSLLSFFFSTCHFSKLETKNNFFLQEQSENEFFKLTFYIEMFYLNTIVQLFLFVEQLDQLEVCLLLTGIQILAVFQNLRWNSNKTSLHRDTLKLIFLI